MTKQLALEQGAAMRIKAVYYGDCLKHLQTWNTWNWEGAILPSERRFADLIYLDPPWNSDANYNILFDKDKNKDKGHTAQEVAFTDIWEWGNAARDRVKEITGNEHHAAYKSISGMETLLGNSGMLAYLSYMAERLVSCRELLKDTGSIYLHCDPTASHYLKMVMDDIFGQKNFRNEIVWDYGKTSNAAAKKFLRGHDIILFYSLNRKKSLFHRQFEAELSTRKKQLVEAGYNTKNMNGQRYLYIYDESKVDAKVKQGKLNMEAFDIVRRVDTTKGNAITDVWEIDHLNSQSKEYLGYPTQKPLALLERIIKASTNEGDVVLDPFCGCGTALEAAALLGREFVGIDISLFSVETVVHDRLAGAGVPIDITGIPAEPAAASRLAKDDAFAFESWAIEACHPGMVGNKVQRGDGGVDGTGMLLHSIKNGKNKVIAQVKAGPPTIENVRAFAFNVQRRAVAGVFITLKKAHWTKGMQEIADSLGKFKYEEGANEYPRLQHWHVGQHFNKKYNRFPILPDLANPLTGKEITRKQLKIYRKQK